MQLHGLKYLTENMNNSNPLLKVSPLKNYAVPFNQISNDHFMEALENAIKEARLKVEEISQNTETATFENTILALETSSDLIDYVASVFFNLFSAHTDEKKQELAKLISPRLAEYSNEVQMNPQLFSRIKAVFDQKDTLDLDQEQRQLLEKTYKSFENS